MVSINYPAYPRGVDLRSIMDATTEGYNAGRDWRDERNGVSAFGSYLDSLYGGQGAQRGPATLADLARQPAQGGVERAPLPPVADYPSQRVSQAFDVARDGGNVFGRFIKTVRDGGVTNPYALAAIAATGKNESGFSPKNASSTWSDPSQSGQPGTAGGIMSWRGPRYQALQQFAQQNGDDPNAPSPETQAKFLLSEDPSLIQRLQSAKSPEEAQTLMNNAWRFAGYNQPGGEAAERVADARGYAEQFGLGQGAPTEQPMQVADASGGIPQQQPASMLPPREDMLALFRSRTTRPLAIQLVKAAQGLSMDANDPMRQLEYRKALLELKQLQEGGAGKMGNSVVWGQDENGDWVAMQPSSAGGLVRAQTPEGVKLSPPGISNLNLGTQFGIRDRSGNIVNTVPIDNAGKASETAQGKAQGEAASSLPGDIQAAEQTVGQIDELLSNPGLDSIVGPADQYRSGWNLGDSGRDALARLNQLKGRAFLQAYSMLKGGGQITEVEGAKAEAAMARMDRAQGESEFRKALEDFRDAVQSGVQKLREKAGQGGAQPAQSQRQRLRFNPQTGELE